MRQGQLIFDPFSAISLHRIVWICTRQEQYFCHFHLGEQASWKACKMFNAFVSSSYLSTFRSAWFKVPLLNHLNNFESAHRPKCHPNHSPTSHHRSQSQSAQGINLFSSQPAYTQRGRAATAERAGCPSTVPGIASPVATNAAKTAVSSSLRNLQNRPNRNRRRTP